MSATSSTKNYTTITLYELAKIRVNSDKCKLGVQTLKRSYSRTDSINYGCKFREILVVMVYKVVPLGFW